MASLRDISWKISYGPQDERLREFFIPALAASVRYDRAAGYFSSTMLALAAAEDNGLLCVEAPPSEEEELAKLVPQKLLAWVERERVRKAHD